MHAADRLALHGFIENVQVSWVEDGLQRGEACLNAGCNDLGGTLMNENSSWPAGVNYDQEISPAVFEAMIRAAGRTPDADNPLRRAGARTLSVAVDHEIVQRPPATSLGRVSLSVA